MEPKVYMPDDDIPERYNPGDIFTFQHGPRPDNIFAFKVILHEPLDARLLTKEEYAAIKPLIKKYAARVNGAKFLGL